MLMIRFLKELYLAGFALAFRFRLSGRRGRWNPSLEPIMDAGRGVFLISIILLVILTNIEGWIEIFIGTRFSFHSNRWATGAIALAFFFVNYYILVIRAHGLKYEREFTHLEKSRKVLLQVSWTIVVLATIVFSIYSISAYQHFFHL
jgi:hypothetical protein